MQLQYKINMALRLLDTTHIPCVNTTKSRASAAFKTVPLTSVARTYPARTTQDSHRYILKCITTMWTGTVAPAVWHYHTIITQHTTICCYVIPLTPYTRTKQRAKRHAASVCDCSKLSSAWNSVQCVEGARPARGYFAANFALVSEYGRRPMVDGAIFCVTHSYLLRRRIMGQSSRSQKQALNSLSVQSMQRSTSRVFLPHSHNETCSKFGHGQDRNIIC